MTSRDLFDLDNFEEYFFRYLWYWVTSLDLKIILLNSWDIISIQNFNNFIKMKIWPLSRILDLEWPSVTSKFTFSHNLTLKALIQIYFTILNKGQKLTFLDIFRDKWSRVTSNDLHAIFKKVKLKTSFEYIFLAHFNDQISVVRFWASLKLTWAYF